MKKILLLIIVFCAATLSYAEKQPLEKVGQELAQGIGLQKEARVAILAFPYHNNRSGEGPFYVSEKLASFLGSDKRMTILERTHIVQILEELHLSETGVMDPASARKIGKALDSNIIVTGTLIDLNNNETELNARALMADTGKVIAASRTLLPRTWREKPKLGWQ
jgi:hypothetical protein